MDDLTIAIGGIQASLQGVADDTPKSVLKEKAFLLSQGVRLALYSVWQPNYMYLLKAPTFSSMLSRMRDLDKPVPAGVDNLLIALESWGSSDLAVECEGLSSTNILKVGEAVLAWRESLANREVERRTSGDRRSVKGDRRGSMTGKECSSYD